METLRKILSDLFSLVASKENNAYYTWGEIAIALVISCFLGFAISLLLR